MFQVTDAYNTAYTPTDLSAFDAATVTECMNVYTVEAAPWHFTYVTAESRPLTTWPCIAETVVHAPEMTVVLT